MQSFPTRLFPAVALLVLAACGDDDRGTRSTASGVTVFERTWIDTSRPIPRTPSRALRTVIWEPGTASPLPLLVLAHGFGGLPEKFDAFARAVAAAGFLVAAPAFPLTNADAPGGHEPGLSDFRNQPGDVSFVIDQLLAASGDPADTLFERIDANRIALLGHSLGGLTALAATRKTCCRDSRVKAVIAVAPLVALFLDQFGTDPISAGPPTLLLHGQADTAIAFQSSVDLYDGIEGPKFLIGLTGVGHSEPLETQELPAPDPRRTTEETTIAFLDAVLLGRASSLEKELDEIGARGHVVEATW